MTSTCGPGQQYENFGHNIQTTPSHTCQPHTLDELVAAVQQAESTRHHHHAHAFGSKWSFNDSPITPDFMIDATGLSGPVGPGNAVQQALLPGAGDPDLLYHVLGGTTIRDLNSQLDGFTKNGRARPLGLITMPASSTMTIAGAISTGSHGTDPWLPPLADTVAAIHLVGAAGTQFWIEPSAPITSPNLIGEFVAPGIHPGDIIYDDSVFDSALVSVGAMGVIYSLVLRVRDQYGLIEDEQLTDWQTFKASALQYLKNPGPYRSIGVIVDPYPDANGVNSCLLQLRQEASVSAATSVGACRSGDVTSAFAGMLISLFEADPVGYGGAAFALGTSLVLSNLVTGQPDFLTIAQRVINFVLAAPNAARLQPSMSSHYSDIMTAWSPPGNCGDVAYQVMDQGTRGAPGSQIGGDSIEITFEALDANDNLPFIEFVDAAINSINAASNTVLVGWFSLRFTMGTRASLGMQQWPRSCSVELSTLPNIRGLPELLSSLLDIGYSLGGKPHWGQRSDGLITQPDASIYARLPEWRSAYARLSDNFRKRTFENAFSRRWQLTTP